MTHDPLCPYDPEELKWVSDCGEPHDGHCQCPLIARVREDQQERLPENGGDATWYLLGQRKGYTDALRDAVEAARTTKYHKDKPQCRCGGCHANNTAVAAIEALGGER